MKGKGKMSRITCFYYNNNLTAHNCWLMTWENWKKWSQGVMITRLLKLGYEVRNFWFYPNHINMRSYEVWYWKNICMNKMKSNLKYRQLRRKKNNKKKQKNWPDILPYIGCWSYKEIQSPYALWSLLFQEWAPAILWNVSLPSTKTR